MKKTTTTTTIDPTVELKAVDTEVKALAKFTAKPIETQAGYEQAANLLKQAKLYLKRIDSVFDPMIASAKATLDAIKTEKATHYQPVKDLDTKLRSLSSAWIELQESIRAKAQAKLDAAREKAEAKNAEREALGKKAKDLPPAIVAPKIETAGVSYREVWDFEITDASKVPDEYWELDLTAIGTAVRTNKGTVGIPGVRIFSTKVAVVR